MELQDLRSQETLKFIQRLDQILESVKRILKNRGPYMQGERYLSNSDLCKILNISLRTLQEYRDTGKISYIKITGKILYKESDVLKLLEDNYYESFK